MTTRTEQQAVAALADAARARNIEMAGEVEPDAIRHCYRRDIDVLEIWKRIAGVLRLAGHCRPDPRLRALPVG